MKLGRWGAGAVGVSIWVAVWQILTTWGPMAGIRGVPTAFSSFSRTIQLLGDGGFWAAIGATLLMALLGLAAALVVGLVLGVVTGLSKTANLILDPIVQFLRPLPPVVILPLVLLILGPTRELGVFLAGFAAMWPILVQTQVGVRDVDPVALDTARSMSLPWLKTQYSVVLPSALPYIATGVRIAASGAVMLAIAAGLLAGAPGLGQRIVIAQQSNQPDLAFGLILWSGIIGLSLAAALTGLEKALVRGRPPEEAA